MAAPGSNTSHASAQEIQMHERNILHKFPAHQQESRWSSRPVNPSKDEHWINTVKIKLEINEKSARQATKNLNQV
jgi:hypothetical protein